VIIERLRCPTCQMDEDHDVEVRFVGERRRDVAYTCHRCLKRRLAQRYTRAQEQNGGAGHLQGRARRART
jgi:transposase-like protein